MITPERPERIYSTRLRTAVVLSGTGSAGAYHAGALRALHEAGVKIDLVAGRGIGAVSAMFAAVDGGVRLWDASGVWRNKPAARFYEWRPALRVAGWALTAALAVLLFPLLLVACAIVIGLIGFLLTLAGFDGAGSAIAVAFTSRLGAWFAPEVLPTTVPRLALLAFMVAIGSLVAGSIVQLVAARGRRRDHAGMFWRLMRGPLASRRAGDALAAELWQLIRGAAPLQQPRDPELGRRYVELLSENLGQPGFRELLVVCHDLDARQDVVFACLGDRQRGRFFGRMIAASEAARATEAFDLRGPARDQAISVLGASLAVPLVTEPRLVSFAVEGPWKGESHWMCDRPGGLTRLLDEVAGAGAEQVVLVSASPRVARVHEISARRADFRGEAGEQLAAFESAGLRDVLEQFAGRFTGLYVIRPEHNPLGPLDFDGVYDERSDRRYTLAELVDRGYEDAYRQFVDPVVGASGERIEADAQEAARTRIELQ